MRCPFMRKSVRDEDVTRENNVDDSDDELPLAKRCCGEQAPGNPAEPAAVPEVAGQSSEAACTEIYPLSDDPAGTVQPGEARAEACPTGSLADPAGTVQPGEARAEACPTGPLAGPAGTVQPGEARAEACPTGSLADPAGAVQPGEARAGVCPTGPLADPAGTVQPGEARAEACPTGPPADPAGAVQPGEARAEEAFRTRMGLRVNKPRAGGSGNSNDGNTARRAFRSPAEFAACTGVDQELIDRVGTVLQAVSCLHRLDIDALSAYCRRTAELYVEAGTVQPGETRAEACPTGSLADPAGTVQPGEARAEACPTGPLADPAGAVQPGEARAEACPTGPLADPAGAVQPGEARAEVCPTGPLITASDWLNIKQGTMF
ncbi:S-antigen protein-like [Amphibalanus amphitrite]|uniref:S-antigen protein-like n=1 Tax=Amphibalanus amphitrite TaxID=1232801 RepID=UPI001C9246DE|nr:S-antigen protein-like [Amphibalanus amphitrite]